MKLYSLKIDGFRRIENATIYFDAVVRNTIESVMVISQNKIKIKYVGGIEIAKCI